LFAKLGALAFNGVMKTFDTFLSPNLQTHDYNISPLAGDASSRRYYRVMSGKQSWVLMEWEPFKDTNDFPFLSVQDYFHKNGIRVPNIHAYCKNTGLFLLEDLGDLTLERRFWEFQNQEVVIPYYKKALDQLIAIHSLNQKQHHRQDCTAFQNEFSVDKLVWEMNYAKKYLLKELLQLQLTPEQETQLESEFHRLCQELYRSPQVICHRDFHSRNVMLHYNDVVIIDFQDARLGPPAYDLVSLIYDSYVNLDPKWTDELIEYYKSHFPDYQNLGLSNDEFQHFFDLQTIQRCFKACGSFASFKVTRDDNRYLDYIRPTLSRVLTQLESNAQLPLLHQVLKDSQEAWESL
jgi:N-acetylmuramate 1-kinase